MEKKNQITVQAAIHAPLEKVWECWSNPAHIVHWNNASDDWHTPHAENDLRTGGKFLSRMEARDGSVGFDFSGTYDKVIEHQLISYSIADGRSVEVQFRSDGQTTRVVETFEAESVHPEEMQKTGWQNILDNFKKYVEQI